MHNDRRNFDLDTPRELTERDELIIILTTIKYNHQYDWKSILEVINRQDTYYSKYAMKKLLELWDKFGYEVVNEAIIEIENCKVEEEDE